MTAQKVLIVEDEDDIREWLQEIIEGWGHFTIGVDRAKLAFEVAKLNDFDTILIDIGLPAMNGMELLHSFREHFSIKANFVCITGYNDFLGEDIKESGFDAVLNKPFTKEELDFALG